MHLKFVKKHQRLKKTHRGRLTGISSQKNKPFFGEFAIEACEPIWFKLNQILAIKKIFSKLKKGHKKGGKKITKLLIKIFPDKSISARSRESRMGAGKGSIIGQIAVVKPGAILFELVGITQLAAYNLFLSFIYKLPIKVNFREKEKIIL
jgi:large subunit ribosomal protein L16